MNFIYNLTKLRLYTNWQEKNSISRHYIIFSKGIGPIFVKIVEWQICCMEPATDTEVLYYTLGLDALVRKYARHPQDASMLAELYKDDVII